MIPVIIYIGAIVCANLSVAAFGPWVSPINSFLLIGLDLSLRDKLHDRWAARSLWPKMLAMILCAGWISYMLNPAAAKVAMASMVAFVAAALADAAAYHLLRKKQFLARANGSNTAGALVDSIVFPLMAFGFRPEVAAMQFAAKMLGGALWAIVLQRVSIRRAA